MRTFGHNNDRRRGDGRLTCEICQCEWADGFIRIEWNWGGEWERAGCESCLDAAEDKLQGQRDLTVTEYDLEHVVIYSYGL